MIIDSHVHIGKTEKSERFFTFESYSNLMKEHKIYKSLVMPNVSSDIKVFDLDLKFLEEYEYLDNKEKFYPFLLIDPSDKFSFPLVCSNYNKIKGVKYHPSITETTCMDPRLYSFFEELPNNFIILVHCGRHWRSHISYMINAANKFHHLIFIAAHMGGNATDLIEEALNLIEKSNLQNIYIDISASKLPWLIEKAISKIGSDKILFGSDEPYGDTLVTKYCLDISKITKEEKDKILYKNSLLLFEGKS